MVERTVIDCDRCGAEVPDPYRLVLCVGATWNGVETEQDNRRIDLCHGCAVAVLHGLANKDMDLAVRVAELSQRQTVAGRREERK